MIDTLKLCFYHCSSVSKPSIRQHLLSIMFFTMLFVLDYVTLCTCLVQSKARLVHVVWIYVAIICVCGQLLMLPHNNYFVWCILYFPLTVSIMSIHYVHPCFRHSLCIVKI